MRAVWALDASGRSVRAVTAVFQSARPPGCGTGFGSFSPDSCCSVVVLLCSRVAATCLQSIPTGQEQIPLIGLPVLVEMRALQRYGSGDDPWTVPLSNLV